MREPYLPPVIWRVVVSGRSGYQTTPASRNYTSETGARDYAASQRARGYSARVFRTEPTWVEVIVSDCVTCGPTATEPHPRREGVKRCVNCKSEVPE